MLSVDEEKQRVIVEKVNFVKRHTKARKQGCRAASSSVRRRSTSRTCCSTIRRPDAGTRVGTRDPAGRYARADLAGVAAKTDREGVRDDGGRQEEAGQERAGKARRARQARAKAPKVRQDAGCGPRRGPGPGVAEERPARSRGRSRGSRSSTWTTVRPQLMEKFGYGNAVQAPALREDRGQHGRRRRAPGPRS